MSEEKVELLLAAVEGTHSVLLLPHNDPDPDAIASAVALRYLLAEKASVDGYIAYHGLISRAENKALVSYLDYPLQSLSSLEDITHSSPVALIDTQPGAGNNVFPSDSIPTIVIDHHPRRTATDSAKFADVRAQVGATSTILTEYLQSAGLEPDLQLATALFYGISTDTMGLSREASPADVTAYFYLQPRIDFDALIDIERAQVPADYFQSFDTALHRSRIYDHVVFTYIGPMAYPDLAAEIADILLRLEGGQWVLCLGVYEDDLVLAVRVRSRQGGAGRLAQAIVGNQGTAGGHGSMAGGLIPLRGREPDRLANHVRQRALQILDIDPQTAWRPIL
jgi:nanoRNase/pAp phosphatase (c-di-AMP/oligoRNAs hydrolase)